MNGSTIVAVAIVAPTSFVIIVIAIFLLCGRGANLLAGYNTMSQEKKDEYDAPALCRFMGKIVLPIGILTPFMLLGKGWFAVVYAVVVVGLVVFAGIYANTGSRFKKQL